MMVLAVSHNIGDPTPHLQTEAARSAEPQQVGQRIALTWIANDRSISY